MTSCQLENNKTNVETNKKITKVEKKITKVEKKILKVQKKIIEFAINNGCLDITDQYGHVVLEVIPKEFLSIKDKILDNKFEIISSDLSKILH